MIFTYLWEYLIYTYFGCCFGIYILRIKVCIYGKIPPVTSNLAAPHSYQGSNTWRRAGHFSCTCSISNNFNKQTYNLLVFNLGLWFFCCQQQLLNCLGALLSTCVCHADIAIATQRCHFPLALPLLKLELKNICKHSAFYLTSMHVCTLFFLGNRFVSALAPWSPQSWPWWLAVSSWLGVMKEPLVTTIQQPMKIHLTELCWD